MITITVPTGSRPIYTENVFSADFNNTTPNKYDFQKIKANRQKLIDLRTRYVYLLDATYFSANMDEGVYQDAMDTSNDTPRLFFTTKTSGDQPAFGRPFNFINYVDNANTVLFIDQVPKKNELLINFQGLFSQPIELAGKLTMEVYIQFLIYEISAVEWVKMYGEPTEQSGKDLIMRGL